MNLTYQRPHRVRVLKCTVRMLKKQNQNLKKKKKRRTLGPYTSILVKHFYLNKPHLLFFFLIFLPRIRVGNLKNPFYYSLWGIEMIRLWEIYTFSVPYNFV